MEAHTVTDYLKEKCLKETLKYAAGRQMFCKNCSKVLDWKTTVVITAEKEGKKAVVIACTDCFNPKGLDKLEAQGFTVEIDKWES